MSRNYAVGMAERAIQAFSDAFFDERPLPKGGPILHLLACSKAEAAESLLALITVNAEDANAIRNLQNNVKLHLDLLKWANKSINQGEQIYANMEIEQKEDMQMAVLTRSGGRVLPDE